MAARKAKITNSAPHRKPMRERRLYLEGPLHVGQEIELPEATARHVKQVLRLRVDDVVTLFDGNGGEYVATLTEVHRSRVVAMLEQHNDVERESPLSISVGQGISRGERMDFVIQKAVELGVRQITPVITQRTVVKLNDERSKRRQAHWQSVANHACEQSGRNQFVVINDVRTLPEWLSSLDSGLRLTLSPQMGTALNQIQWHGQAVHLLIGPEGGLSEREVEQAQGAEFQPIQLGPRILRTETATLTALAALQMLWGDFNR